MLIFLALLADGAFAIQNLLALTPSVLSIILRKVKNPITNQVGQRKKKIVHICVITHREK